MPPDQTNLPSSENASEPSDGKTSARVEKSLADLEASQGSQSEANVHDASAFETFEFEVTAGHAMPSDHQPSDRLDVAKQPAAQTAKASTPEPVDAATKLRADQHAEPKPKTPVGILLDPGATQPSNVIGNVVETNRQQAAPQEVTIQQTDEVAPTGAQSVRRVARESSWWITSLGVHVLILLGLAFSTLAVMQEEELELYASPVVYETVEEFEDLEIDPSEDLDELEEELSEPDIATLEELTSETLIEEPTVAETPVAEAPTTDAESSLSELGDLFGATEVAAAGMDSEVGMGTGGSMAKFFGTEVKARRILYMLDNSGGMRKGGKFEALVEELKASVDRLSPKQEFYVIFYSDTVYPLFYPQGIRKFVRSNKRNRKMLAAWLETVELCGGNAIDEALEAAEIIRPEAVFLLTDGDLFTTDKKKAMLLNRGRRDYSIHTFGLGVGKKTKTADGLNQVAEANKGTFRTIKVTDEMKELAKETQRPYHNKKPGPVWGLRVGKR